MVAAHHAMGPRCHGDKLFPEHAIRLINGAEWRRPAGKIRDELMTNLAADGLAHDVLASMLLRVPCHLGCKVFPHLRCRAFDVVCVSKFRASCRATANARVFAE